MKPFMKWVGGKSQLLPEIVKLIPDHKKYYEPFIGGGALFFQLEPKEAVIGDLNKRLINLYQSIRDYPDTFSEVLKWMENVQCTASRFKTVRSVFNSGSFGKVEDAVLFVYLLRHCFNGLYRVTKQGMFNTPWNKDNRVLSVDHEVFKRASDLLKNTKIINAPYYETLNNITPEDFVYLDPPYDPVSATASFTAYTKDQFSQEDLADYLGDLTRKGIRWLLSNSSTDKIRDLYKDYKIQEVSVRRNINSVSNKRSGTELLIRNY